MCVCVWGGGGGGEVAGAGSGRWGEVLRQVYLQQVYSPLMHVQFAYTLSPR